MAECVRRSRRAASSASATSSAGVDAGSDGCAYTARWMREQHHAGQVLVRVVGQFREQQRVGDASRSPHPACGRRAPTWPPRRCRPRCWHGAVLDHHRLLPLHRERIADLPRRCPVAPPGGKWHDKAHRALWKSAPCPALWPCPRRVPAARRRWRQQRAAAHEGRGGPSRRARQRVRNPSKRPRACVGRRRRSRRPPPGVRHRWFRGRCRPPWGRRAPAPRRRARPAHCAPAVVAEGVHGRQRQGW